MESTKEQMVMIHDMCCKEINLLKINLDKLIQESEQCQKLLSELMNAEGVANIFGLIVFDRYMTQMVTALNMSRKYNIHLEINNLEQTVINASSNSCLDDTDFSRTRLLKDFFEWRKTIFDDVRYGGEINAFAGRIKISETHKDYLCGYSNSRMKSLELSKNNERTNLCATDKTKNVSKNVDNLLNILLPPKSLSEFKSGFEFEAWVVYVRDYKKLEFFICLNDDYKTLCDICSNINFKQISREHLPLDDVFCVLEKKDSITRECLWRAVIVPEERHDLQKHIYLIDFGETIPLTDNCETFIAPLRYRQIPPLAIKCILEGIEDSVFKCNKYQYKCKQALQKNEFEKASFRILHQKDGVLHVLMLETPRTSGSSIPIKTNQQTNPFLNYNDAENDDQNTSTSSDIIQLPRSAVYDAPLSNEPVLKISFGVGDKIRAIVTHVVSPISFYGIVQNDYCSDYTSFSWHDRQIFPLQQKMSSPPQVNDIVLSQYAKDGYWYRAKVVNIDSITDLYQVFYVDFGNTEVVPLSSLAKCSNEQLQDPLRAVLFHLSHLSIVSDEQNVHSSEKNNLQNVIESMVVLILDQIINVEVVERRNDDLVVRLIDSQYANIPKMLIDMGVAKEI